MTTKIAAETQPVILLTDDYEILNGYIKNLQGMQVNEKENFRKLYREIKRAHVVDAADFPDDTIRLGSDVVIRDLQSHRDMALTIVMPEYADIKQRKVSVLAPIGTALIGFRKGRKVSWEVPAGTRNFLIMEVRNTLHAEKPA
jgi:regulator of nucleoside diphosphate kinase